MIGASLGTAVVQNCVSCTI